MLFVYRIVHLNVVPGQIGIELSIVHDRKRFQRSPGRHILIAAYAMLKTADTEYEDLGVNYFDQRDRRMVVRPETRRLEALSYKVTVEPIAGQAIQIKI